MAETDHQHSRCERHGGWVWCQNWRLRPEAAASCCECLGRDCQPLPGATYTTFDNRE